MSEAPVIDNPSGAYCPDCRAQGVMHCARPEECGGMLPMTPLPETWHLNGDGTVAVSDHRRFQPMETCPTNAKVLLLGLGGVATLGTYDGHTQWGGWFPIPGEHHE